MSATRTASTTVKRTIKPTGTRVFKAHEALAAIEANPQGVLLIEKKKTEKETKFGTKYLNAFFNIGDDKRKAGWFYLEDIPVRGVADPKNTNDKRNKHTGTRLQLETTVEQAGIAGEFIYKLHKEWMTLCNTLCANRTIVKGNRAIHGLVQDKISEDNTENPGGDIEDPIIRFKVDFTKYPAGYPNKDLVGEPKTQFYDYDTEYLDEKNVPQYKLATVPTEDGTGEELVNESNLHRFVTDGSVVKKLRFSIASAVVSGNWVSLPMLAGKVVLQRGVEGGWSDEVPLDVEECVRESLVNQESTEEVAQKSTVEEKTPVEVTKETDEATQETTEVVKETPVEEKATETPSVDSDALVDFLNKM